MDEIIFNFKNKNFLVTGASSGIGRQITKELAMAGAKILALARDEGKLKALQEEIFGDICINSVDVTNYDRVEKCIDVFVTQHGKLHGSVHAAGIIDFTPLRAFNMEQAKKIMDTSFWAGINVLQLATKRKYAEDCSSHVQISSVNAYRGQRGLSAYGAVKAATPAAIRAIAKEIASRGHRVNSVSPGLVNTDMTRQNLLSDNLLENYLLGMGNPEDVSGLVLFLLSNRARWITGADFIVDGGYLA
ncbi:SDR family NAD(P)-dependent oxidoreductase [Propionispora vibrioides]|uniref:NAD(P)-dependent dehydrogenase, short-chain alcohol dehydrogenase family n=1 Tax=Propionispora vibrioides TaxID=112903 RepID=A0A1H8RXC4_9FIRM|nr:SDR family NAD(P)-dependent oxidoreductase [Propionispora vibrioides]SEO70583.1 NAD(P)-dependent dehydrogenase, short-chain alcohol dehydrogenase family [Propionispora vibrioides]